MTDTPDIEMLLRFPIGCRVKVLENGLALPVGTVGTVTGHGTVLVYVLIGEVSPTLPGSDTPWSMYSTEIEEVV
jgi:hypothetical protein